MEKRKEQRGLGRGLSALMADVRLDETAEEGDAQLRRAETMLPIERLAPNPEQPRREFSQEALQDLARSIGEKGIIQPLIVRRRDGDTEQFEIVAGERRWRAAQMAQLHEVPVILRDLGDTEVLEVAIVENIQRADLNPVEEAMGYRQLMDRFGHTQEKLAAALGKSRSHIANLLRLLTLPEAVLDHLRAGRLSAGHARALVGAEDPAALAARVTAHGLSVRETEKLASAPAAGPETPPRASKKDADTRALEQSLSASLGQKVRIDHKAGSETGRVTIRYATLEELERLCGLLNATGREESI